MTECSLSSLYSDAAATGISLSAAANGIVGRCE